MKNIFVLNVNDFRPDLTRFTFPTIQRYGEKIGANVIFLTARCEPEAPISLEKVLQVHRLGEGAEWNILIDADTMVHPDTPDFTKGNPAIVFMAKGTDTREMFPYHEYFHRCGHFQGVAGNFIVTSKLTHDLWEPWPDWKTLVEKLQRPFNIDEYILSLNLARYGLRFSGILPAESLEKFLVHFGNDEKSPEARANDAKLASLLFESWGFVE